MENEKLLSGGFEALGALDASIALFGVDGELVLIYSIPTWHSHTGEVGKLKKLNSCAFLQ